MSLSALFLRQGRMMLSRSPKSRGRRLTHRADLQCEVLEERMVLTRSSWTIMLYITADNALAEGLNGNIKQMESALAQFDNTAPNAVQVAVLYDQTQSSTANLFATPVATANGIKPAQTWQNTGEAVLQADATDPASRGITTPFTLIGAKNSGTTAVFSQFVSWATTAAPADHYALVFGDHGAGWRGFNNYGDGALNTPGIAGALNTLAAGANPVRFDLIGFDECLMADAQAEASVANNAQVLVGSEELEGGSGWNFQTAFSALDVANPGSVTAVQIGTSIVNSFTSSYVNGKTDGSKRTDTLSAVQTSALGNLNAKLNAFTAAVLDPATTTADWNALAWARNQAPWYSQGQGEGYRDLGTFLTAVANSPGVSQSIRTAATNARTALNAAIIAKTGDSRQSTGLTVYFPGPGETVSADYFDPANAASPGLAATFVNATNWYNFLTAFTQNAPAQATVPAGFTGGGSNRSVATAFDLRQLIGLNNTFSGLSLPVANPAEDSDYFHFAIAAPGVAGNAVSASYPTGAGDLELTLLDAQSNEIGQSNTASGLESISLSGLAAGDYYIVVSSSNDISVPSYTLTINAPTPDVIPADWATGNSTKATAFDLGTIASIGEFSGLTLASEETDWFQFDLAPDPDPQDAGPNSLTVLGSNSQNLTVQIQNEQGQVLTSLSGQGAVTLIYPQVPGGMYFLKVTGAPGGYAIHFNPPVLTSNSLELDSESLSPGQSFTLGGAVENAGVPQSHTILVNWGDGSPQTTLTLAVGDTSFQAQHQYAQVGSFVITATGVSPDGAVGSGTLDAQVQATVAETPTVEAEGDASLFVGQQLTRPGTVTLQSGTLDGATVNYGDGTGTQPVTLDDDGTFVLSHFYARAGVFTVVVQATGNVGAIGTASFGVNSQVAPVVTNAAVQLTGVALALAHSSEFDGRIVDQDYQLVLHRAAEAGARTFWVSQLQGGLSQQQLAAALLSSPEFVAGQSNSNWLQQVYQRLFNRPVDDGGQRYWEGLLAGGISKGSVASSITEGAEFIQTQVASTYSQILGRTPDAGGLAFWTSKVEAGARLENVAAGLLASDEFFGSSRFGKGNAVAWIDAAYLATFNRHGSTTEEAFWLGQI